MARNWPHLPSYQTEQEAEIAKPTGWTVSRIEDLYEKLETGKLFDQKTCTANGTIPVVAQSAEGYTGYHSENPGVDASVENPVVTFANHTCEMRLMRRPFSVIQNVFPMRGKPGICDTTFLYYATKGRVHLQEYKGHYPDYRRLWIPLPKLAEQQRIAGILGQLDDKIELNRKMNETLEQMARALFKSWFVDFDPVHAKAAGRKPAGIDKANSDLFPDELVDSQLGAIPRGWGTATLSDCCEKIFSGGTPDRSRKDFWHGNIPWLSSGETRNSFIIKTEECITPAGVENSSTRLAKRGNTVIASAGQGQTRGQTSLLSGDFYINQSIIALEPKNGEPYELFNYFGMERRYDELRQLSDSNSSRGSLTTKLVAQMPVIIPPKQLLKSFDKIVAPIVSAIVNNEAQSESLSSTRDAVVIKLLGK
jgi:type I restriction enzyme, S subunit